MKTAALNKTLTKSSTSDITTEVSRVGFYILLTVAMGFGILSVSALVAGAINAGGIIPLLGMMFGALV